MWRIQASVETNALHTEITAKRNVMTTAFERTRNESVVSSTWSARLIYFDEWKYTVIVDRGITRINKLSSLTHWEAVCECTIAVREMCVWWQVVACISAGKTHWMVMVVVVVLCCVYMRTVYWMDECVWVLPNNNNDKSTSGGFVSNDNNEQPLCLCQMLSDWNAALLNLMTTIDCNELIWIRNVVSEMRLAHTKTQAHTHTHHLHAISK